MFVQHFLGEKNCDTCEELEKELEKRNEKGVNGFILSFDEDLPLIYMNVNKKYASLNFYYEDNDPGYVSIGNNTDLDENGDMVFYTALGNKTFLVPDHSVVMFEEDKQAAVDFLKLNSCHKVQNGRDCRQYLFGKKFGTRGSDSIIQTTYEGYVYRYEPSSNTIFIGTETGGRVEPFYVWGGRECDFVITILKGLGFLSEIIQTITGYDICLYCGWEDDGTTDIGAYRSINKGSILDHRNRISENLNKYYLGKWLKE